MALGRRFDSVQNPENSNFHGFELHSHPNKGTKLLLKVILVESNHHHLYTRFHPESWRSVATSFKYRYLASRMS